MWDVEAAGVDEADCSADCGVTLLAYLLEGQGKSSSDMLSANDG